MNVFSIYIAGYLYKLLNNSNIGCLGSIIIDKYHYNFLFFKILYINFKCNIIFEPETFQLQKFNMGILKILKILLNIVHMVNYNFYWKLNMYIIKTLYYIYVNESNIRDSLNIICAYLLFFIWFVQ